MTTASQRCGFCAIIGAPNAGKSTLVNALVGSKISIVSHKVQTTRARIRAIAIEGSTQIIFVDTPGIFKPKRKLDEKMIEGAWSGAGEADATIVLIDAAKGLDDECREILESLKTTRLRLVLALNKIDLIPRDRLLALSAAVNAIHAFPDTFMISAQTGSGVHDLKRHVADLMPAGPWLYPEDQIADAPMRFFASEVTREKIYDRLHDELPYSTTVETEAWEERKDGSVKISQVIYVERDSQKKIVLGKGGQQIKLIGQLARKEIEEMLGRRAHLFLFVKVRERWTEDPERFAAMGLDTG